jgi:hypothetical protein
MKVECIVWDGNDTTAHKTYNKKHYEHRNKKFKTELVHHHFNSALVDFERLPFQQAFSAF